MRRDVARRFGDPRNGRRRVPAVVPPRAVGLPACASGRTLWDELVVRYTRGVDEVRQMRRTWAALRRYVDAQRYAEVAGVPRHPGAGGAMVARRLHRLFPEPRRACRCPPATPRRAHPLAYYEAIDNRYAPGRDQP